MKQLNNETIKVLKYFSIFAYHPTLDEIYTFLPVKIDKNKLKYTPPQYSIKEIKNLKLRIKNSKKKLNNLRFRVYIKLISLFTQIRLVGLSGSISMMNAKEDDDIDLFIITEKKRLFTGRLIALVLAQILGLRRMRNETMKQSNNNFHDKVCLNLFFDENNLKVPKFKQTEFVGHEVLQMKPIVAKGNIYERFLAANRWVFKIFPNAKENLEFKIQNSELKKKIINSKFIILNFGRIIELIFKKIQLNSINKHRTTEIITSSQLWFHPDDFEKKIKY